VREVLVLGHEPRRGRVFIVRAEERSQLGVERKRLRDALDRVDRRDDIGIDGNSRSASLLV
jgi:hypothetical protein